MTEKARSDLRRQIERDENFRFGVTVTQEIYKAYKETRNAQGKHRYCKNCMYCDMRRNCIAPKARKDLCYQAKKITLLKKENLYGERNKKN